MNTGYADTLAAIAKKALLSIKGDLAAMLTGVIKDRPLGEKKLALQMALDSDKLNDDQKSQISEFALDIGLHSSAADSASKTILRDMRFQAAASIGARKYVHATGFMIEHLDMTIGEFDKGLVDRNHLLDAISNFGSNELARCRRAPHPVSRSHQFIHGEREGLRRSNRLRRSPEPRCACRQGGIRRFDVYPIPDVFCRGEKGRARCSRQAEVVGHSDPFFFA